MKSLTQLIAVALWLALELSAQSRETIGFDRDWRFLKSDAPNAEQSGFDDSSWRKLDVPHDWSIEGPFAETNKTGGAGAFLPSGVAWYRKTFSLPAADAARRVFVEFDGVMANSDVWINGFKLGHRPNGYVSFGYDLTGHLNFGAGKTNVLAVRADTSQQPASRWYTGAGIYRHVRLIVTDPVHFERWGNFITASPNPDAPTATIHARSTVQNDSDSAREISVRLQILDATGKKVAVTQTAAQSVAPRKSATFESQTLLLNPKLWKLEDPRLYRAVLSIRASHSPSPPSGVKGQPITNRPITLALSPNGGEGITSDAVFDEEAIPFGIRHFEFRADTGFWLNGKNFKLYGVCLHHDGSAFGAAVPLSVWEYRLTQLRKTGVNAIRTAHNPVAPEFLDLCDRMGFLVMDEFFDCWTVGKNPFDYHLYFNEWSKVDLRDTIRRDRNHPSIVLYSVGNEIHDTPQADLAKRILKGLVDVCHENDPTRPVTQALFRPNVSHDYDNGLADLLDVIGTNYRDNELLAAQRQKPSRKIIGTEQRHDRQTWLWLRDNPSHAGQFLWTGIDYFGESRRWPLVSHASGLLDRTGEIKPMAFERESWWSSKPVVRIVRRVAKDDVMPSDPGYGGPELHTQVQFADWTPRNLNPHDESVEVYSNCGEVELFLKGKSLGTKKLPTDASPRIWRVKFEPGAIKAAARNDGKTVATAELRTAVKPVKILLTATQTKLAPGWDNVAFVNVAIVDDKGVPIPNANDLISFNITGPGAIAAVDSADNASHELFQTNERHAFQGRCQAIVKATASKGRITLTATAPGLVEGKVTLEATTP